MNNIGSYIVWGAIGLCAVWVLSVFVRIAMM